jgi:hypothetical protein
MVVNGYSNNTRLKTYDPNWTILGYQPRDNAENYRAMLRDKGIDVDAPDRDEWEWPEHGGSHARVAERRPAIANRWGRILDLNGSSGQRRLRAHPRHSRAK